MGLLREDPADDWRREADLEAVTIAVTAIIAGIVALAVTPGGIPWEPLIIGAVVAIGRWQFFGYESLEAVRDASVIGAAHLRAARPHSALRGAVIVTVTCLLISALSTFIAEHVLRGFVIGIVIFGFDGLLQWIAVRHVERERGVLVYRQAADYFVCRPDPVMDAFGR